MIKFKLDLDNTPETKDNKSIVYGKNMVLDGKVPRNENGCSTHFTAPTNHKINGRISLPNGEVIFYTDNADCGIEVVENGVTRIILRTQYLVNNVDNPIEGIYKYNNKGELIISWWDGIRTNSNHPCILNVDSLPFSVDPITYELIVPAEITKIFIFPDYNQTIIEVTSVGTGGSLNTAKYSFICRYEIADNNYTDFTIPTRDVWIANNKDESAYIVPDLFLNVEDFGENTNKSISLNINNLDSRYKYLLLSVIITEGVNQRVEEIGRYYIEGLTNINIIYAGQKIGVIQLSELTDRIRFDKVFTGTYHERRQTLGNIKTKEAINYQKYANNIKVRWTSSSYAQVSTQCGGYMNENGKATFYYRSLCPDEVYALYFHWIFKDGSISEGFHIPGRADLGGDATSIYTGVSHEYALPYVREFHVHNRATIVGNDGLGNPYGELSYWENYSEDYPDTNDYDIWDATGIIGTLRPGVKVRHHKMPNMFLLNDGLANVHRVIGLEFDDVYCPPEIDSLVVGWTISFAKRTSQNMTVLGMSDLLRFEWEDGDALAPPPPQTGYRIHDFLMLSEKPSLDVAYVKAQYLVDVSPPGYGELILSDPLITFGANCDRITDWQYLPADNTSSVPTNVQREECLYLESSEAATLFNNELVLKAGLLFANFINLYVGTICAHRLDVYTDFANQELIPSGLYFDKTVTNPSSVTLSNGDFIRLHFGDTFLSKEIYSFCYPAGPAPTVPTYTDNYFISRYSPANYQFRTKPYPGWNWYLGAIDNNDYDYHDEWTRLLTVKASFAFDTYLTRLNHFPYRIVRCIPDMLEGIIETWRIYVYSDYFECEKQKGHIYRLASLNDSLIIRHTESMYIAKVKDSFTADGQQVLLEESTLFARDPDEVIPTSEGYFGCSSKFADFIFEGGYFGIDRKTGRVVVVTPDGQFNKLHLLDVEKYFKSNLDTSSDIDNPYALMGVIATYDSENARLIMTKRDYNIPNFEGQYSGNINDYSVGDTVLNDGIVNIVQAGTPNFLASYDVPLVETSFTISFNIKVNAWGTFHDYFPGAYFFNRIGVFAILNDKIYKHNVHGIKGTYYDSTVHTSYIDVIFTAPQGVPKLLVDAVWNTDVIDRLQLVRDYDLTIDRVMIYNDTQCSGSLEVKTNDDWFNVENGKDVNGNWFFSNFADCVINNKAAFLTNMLPNANVNSTLKNWFDRSVFLGTYIIVRLQYNNTVYTVGAVTYQNDIFINDANITIQKSTL